MPDPTLAEVLAQYAAARIGDESTEETERSLSIARSLALQYVLDRREWLARCELEQAARKAVGAIDGTPVRVLPTDDAPELFTVHYEDSDCCMVEVGANWKPEAGR